MRKGEKRCDEKWKGVINIHIKRTIKECVHKYTSFKYIFKDYIEVNKMCKAYISNMLGKVMWELFLQTLCIYIFYV